MVKKELLNQRFYKDGQNRLWNYKSKLARLGYNLENDASKLSLSADNLELNSNQEIACKTMIENLKEQIRFNENTIEWLEEYEDPSDLDKEFIKSQTKLLEKQIKELNDLYTRLYNSYSYYTEEIYNNNYSLDELLEDDYPNYFGENMRDDIFTNSEGQMTVGDTFGNFSFENLISNAKNSALENWYRFLQDLHESPIRSFVLNKNTICNFKLVFKNPYTGLTTDKETVVHLSHSTSAKKTPVFSIGSVSYKATSTGVKLLAGSFATVALDNVPLPYLHAISYMNHSSVEDLPPLDLYIIPIENISEKGRYEVLLIKGIQFTDMKQSDTASSTGVYYAFNYFAEDIIPLDFSESEKYFKIQYEGNYNL